MGLGDNTGRAWHRSYFQSMTHLCMHQNVGCVCEVEGDDILPTLNCAEPVPFTRELNEGHAARPPDPSRPGDFATPAVPGFRQICEDSCYCRMVSPIDAKAFRLGMHETSGLGRLSPGFVRPGRTLTASGEGPPVSEWSGARPDLMPQPSEASTEWPEQSHWLKPTDPVVHPQWTEQDWSEPSSPTQDGEGEDWPSDQGSAADQRPNTSLRPGGGGGSGNRGPSRDVSCPRSSCWKANTCMKNGGSCSCVVPRHQISQRPPLRAQHRPPIGRMPRFSAVCGGLRAAFKRDLSNADTDTHLAVASWNGSQPLGNFTVKTLPHKINVTLPAMKIVKPVDARPSSPPQLDLNLQQPDYCACNCSHISVSCCSAEAVKNGGIVQDISIGVIDPGEGNCCSRNGDLQKMHPGSVLQKDSTMCP